MIVKTVSETGSQDDAHFQMDCRECAFIKYLRSETNGEQDISCHFGRRAAFHGEGLTDGPLLNTFCSYARDEEWFDDHNLSWDEGVKRVISENRVKYDLVVRMDNSAQIEKLDAFISLENPPKRIILSCVGPTKELLEKLPGTNLQLLRIFNEERRLELEYESIRDGATWFQVTHIGNLEPDLMAQFNSVINESFERVICVPGRIYMKPLCEALLNSSLEICDQNIVQMAKDQGLEHMVRTKEKLYNG